MTKSELERRVVQLEREAEAGHESRLELGVYVNRVVGQLNAVHALRTALQAEVKSLKAQNAELHRRVAEAEGDLEQMRRLVAEAVA